MRIIIPMAVSLGYFGVQILWFFPPSLYGKCLMGATTLLSCSISHCIQHIILVAFFCNWFFLTLSSLWKSRFTGLIGTWDPWFLMLLWGDKSWLNELVEFRDVSAVILLSKKGRRDGEKGKVERGRAWRWWMLVICEHWLNPTVTFCNAMWISKVPLHQHKHWKK